MSGAPKVSVVIPTRRRPQSLARAVRSVFRQEGLTPAEIELVVVDNDADAGSRAIAQTLTAEAPFALRYVCEPEAGVANARNRGLAVARGAMIAFLDDDEEASPGWLAALLEVQARFGADVVFGPVRGCAPEPVRAHRAYLERFFSREGPAKAGLLDHYYGCGDSLLVRASLPSSEPFSRAQNHIGGEDDVLFQQMKGRGARFAWAPAAWVLEHPDPARLTLGYTLRRAFAYGQGPSYACARRDPPDPLGALRWMAIGAVQALAYGGLAAVKWLARAPDRAFVLDRAVRGLGKLLWFPPFKVRFYGL